MKRFLTPSLLFGALLAAPTIPAATATSADPSTPPKKYLVNLSPAWKVGQKFAYVADASYVTHTEVADPQAPIVVNTAILSHLEGTGEVLAVAPSGAMTKMSLTVIAMNASSNGRPVDNKPIGKLPRPIQMLDPGAVVVVERDDAGHETFQVDGKPVAGGALGVLGPSMTVGRDGQVHYSGAAMYLKMLIDLDTPPGTNQGVFGPKEAVAVGDTWLSNSNPRTKLLEPFWNVYTYLVPPMSATYDSRLLVFPATPATVKLASVTGEGDSQVWVVSGNLSITAMDYPAPPSPIPGKPFPKMSLDLQDEFTLTCPATTTKGVLIKTSTLSAKEYPAPVQPPGPTLAPSTENLDFKYTQQYTFK